MTRFTLLFITLLFSYSPAQAQDGSIYDAPLKLEEAGVGSRVLGDFAGKPVVLGMAYTRCKSACPITMQRLKRIEQLAREAKKPLRIVVVSLDPERDSVQDLEAFKQHYSLSPDIWHVMRATPAATRQLAVLLGISFERDPATNEILHSNRIALLNERGELIYGLDGLASDVAQLVSAVP